MGLLDDLKEQAEQIRATGQARQSSAEQCEAYYRDQTRPALARMLEYLNELLEQIRVVKPEVIGEFRIPGYQGVLPGMQALPVVNIDSRDNIKQINVGLGYLVSNQAFSITPIEAANEARDFLLGARYVFSDWPIRGQDGAVNGLRFTIGELRIPASIRIQADVEGQRLQFRSYNVRGFHDEVDWLRPEDVNDDWLDRLGRYLIGNGQNPQRLELAGEQRQRLQRMVEESRAERERELAERELELQRAEEQQRKSSRIHRLLDSVRERLPTRPDKE